MTDNLNLIPDELNQIKELTRTTFDKLVNRIISQLRNYDSPLRGNYYDTFTQNLGDYKLIVKKLRSEEELPQGETLSDLELFSKHQREYEKFIEAFKGTDMILPTVFISYPDLDNYFTFQPFVENPILQYKLWTRNRSIIENIPEDIKHEVLKQLEAMLERFKKLLDRNSPYLMDLDFFVIEKYPYVIIFDTSHFWPDKRDGKDRMYLERDIEEFIKLIKDSLV